MRDSELKDIERNIRDAIKDTGDSSGIMLKRFDARTKSNVFGESKIKKYLSPISVTGRVLMNPSPEELKENGLRSDDITLVFTFALGELRKCGLVDGNSLPLISNSDILSYKGKDYSIIEISGRAMLGDRFMVWKVGAK
jgi:hypothetical protein